LKHYGPVKFIDDLFDELEWLFANKKKRNYLKNVPPYCRTCEVLGLCRDEQNNWKCRNGCRFIKKDKNNKKP